MTSTGDRGARTILISEFFFPNQELFSNMTRTNISDASLRATALRAHLRGKKMLKKLIRMEKERIPIAHWPQNLLQHLKENGRLKAAIKRSVDEQRQEKLRHEKPPAREELTSKVDRCLSKGKGSKLKIVSSSCSENSLENSNPVALKKSCLTPTNFATGETEKDRVPEVSSPEASEDKTSRIKSFCMRLLKKLIKFGTTLLRRMKLFL